MNNKTLRGQPFIGKIERYDNPEDLAYGETSERRCGVCFYRDGPKNPTFDCQIILRKGEKTPHELFRIPKNKRLPEIIDGEEVGNYCPYFLDYRAE